MIERPPDAADDADEISRRRDASPSADARDFSSSPLTLLQAMLLYLPRHSRYFALPSGAWSACADLRFITLTHSPSIRR